MTARSCKSGATAAAQVEEVLLIAEVPLIAALPPIVAEQSFDGAPLSAVVAPPIAPATVIRTIRLALEASTMAAPPIGAPRSQEALPFARER
jgi:hypothetical protein